MFVSSYHPFRGPLHSSLKTGDTFFGGMSIELCVELCKVETHVTYAGRSAREPWLRQTHVIIFESFPFSI